MPNETDECHPTSYILAAPKSFRLVASASSGSKTSELGITSLVCVCHDNLCMILTVPKVTCLGPCSMSIRKLLYILDSVFLFHLNSFRCTLAGLCFCARP
jgi:hypothetical protein